MDLPETESLAGMSSPSTVQADQCWGEEFLLREIALLEEHLLERNFQFKTIDQMCFEIVCIAVAESLRYDPFDVGRSTWTAIATLLLAAAILRRREVFELLYAAKLIRFLAAAQSALNRLPLFFYGPELSEFRHRYR